MLSLVGGFRQVMGSWFKCIVYGTIPNVPLSIVGVDLEVEEAVWTCFFVHNCA